jgi:hypothetical protein
VFLEISVSFVFNMSSHIAIRIAYRFKIIHMVTSRTEGRG